MEIRFFLEEMGLQSWPKTSGSRGMHVNVRIHRRWTFPEIRRAAVAVSRAIERRISALASSKWWEEERRRVFRDYNQNAKDRTTCAAYSVRPLPDARVSAPLDWREVPDCDPADFTVLTMPGASRTSATLTQLSMRRRTRSKNFLSSRRKMSARGSPTHPGLRISAKWRAKQRAWRRRAPKRPA